MTLAFSETINEKPSYFIEKIWDGLLDKKLAHGIDYMEYDEAFKKQFGKIWDVPLPAPIFSKLHTIREDPSNRWRAGMDVHMVINNRTKNRFQFAPVVKCVSVQEIEITDISHLTFGCLHGIVIDYPTSDPGCTFRLLWSIRVDGKELLEDEITKLAINDGFDSVEDFFAYFDKDFKGKLIIWGDIKY